MKKILKSFCYLLSGVFLLGPLIGCGIFNPPAVDANGYHIKHFNCCGPIAIETALAEYNRRAGIVNKRRIASEEISKQIQNDGIALKRFLSFFHKDIVCATWSWEMESTVKKYGFELISVDNFKKLDPSKDIAFVLVRGKFLSNQWHWMCYPVNKNIETYFGKDTVIDKILLLKKI